MPFASGSQLQVSIVRESTPGETPASPKAKVLRVTSCTLGMERNTIESAELRSDRMISNVNAGMRRVQGDVDFEFSPASFDELIEAVLGGTFVPVATSGSVELSITASTRTISRATGSFVTDGFVVGQWVSLDGFSNAGNNTIGKIATVSALAITLTNLTTTLVDEAASPGKLVNSFAGVLKTGTTQRSFSVEVGFKNIAQYRLFKGCYPDKWNVSIKPNDNVKMKMSFIGIDEATSTSPMDVTPDPALTTKTIDGNSALAVIKEGGVALAYITGMDFVIDNQGKSLEVIGANKAAGINWGRSKITGTITAYIPDFTLYNKYVNDTNSSLELILADGTVGSYSLKFPNVKYTAAKADVGNEDASVQSMPFSALYDPVTGTNILITKS